MMLRVRERGDEVHIEVDGLAGRQLRVLQALTRCQRLMNGAGNDAAASTDVNVRAGTDTMRIRLKGREGLRFEAASIYQCMREALLECNPPGSDGSAAP